MKELKFVDVGEGITEGHFQKWLIPDGGSVKEDQAIAQIETDKAVVNLPAPISGVLKQVAKEDSIVKVGDTLAFVGTADELKGSQSQPQSQKPAPTQQAPTQPQPKATATPQPAKTPSAPQAKQPAATPTEIITTPYVRKFARDSNVDITKVVGTGPGGRILENDVKNFLSQTPSMQKPLPKFSEVLE